MGFTFRKRVKVMKGVHLNVGKTGTSLSVGGKGFSVTQGRGRTSVSVGIPGTGLSYRSSAKSGQRAAREVPAGPDRVDDEERAESAYERGRAIAELGVVRWLCGKLLRVLGALLIGAVALGLLATLASIKDGNAIETLLGTALVAALAGACWLGGARVLRR